MEFFNYILEQLTYKENQPLIFNTGLFFVLFVIFYAIYIGTQHLKTFRVIYVLAFSLFFYYKSSGIFFLLLIASTVWDFYLSIGIERCRSEQKTRRFLLLLLSLAGNLGLLFYFKYSNLLIDSINQLSGNNYSHLDLILPVGISFYTFQTMSYTIDVYRREMKAERNIFDFAFFVSFFPQLVAGPIVRAKDFMPQIREKLSLDKSEMGQGIWLILCGLLKKGIISDYISTNFVDRVFINPTLYSGAENLLAVYGYTIQIYCDFSGYSDMAIGIALLMGFKLAPNFNAPYQSLSVTDFWRRWHISLSTWLRDYLYVPLGGNRGGSFVSIFFILVFMGVFYMLMPGSLLLIIYAVMIVLGALIFFLGKEKNRAKFFNYLNLMVTMLLGGFWHGASWRFVVWGALHGGALALEKLLKPITGKINKYWPVKIIGWFLTFHFVAFCWIYFRASSFDTANQVISQIGTDMDFGLIPTIIKGYWKVFILLGIGYLIHFYPPRFENWMQKQFIRMHWSLQSVAMAIMIWLLIQIAGTEIHPFIYFQF
jgi:D-alanyl-lipoteichoic acid acyltransferase DltB (MBOAT superfamily)